ncbi:MAG: PEP-CTERM sorting domain-containing protein, partial [Verrucomicrobiae bacterium]|nr:PEP-CTERM sorting domain-containing protein [Verrucomicrobiae bacterium]
LMRQAILKRLKRGRAHSPFKLAGLTLAAFIGGPAYAANLITEGFTFAVASGGGVTDIGTHYHSNTGGAFGNPAGKAEVGRFGSEEVRGLSEYNLTGLGTATSAYVSFDVFKAGGLFDGVNDRPFTGKIIVDAYAGNNLENISDYGATSLGEVGIFNVSTLIAGDIFSFDITSIFNAAIAAGNTSLGIRLREDRSNPDYNSSLAWTFDTFRLTSDNLTTKPGAVVPEPESFALVGLVLVGAAFSRRLAH